MKIRSIEVWDFGRVEHASLSLGKGLNVFFGPNDLGKTTIVRALRAALLLPHTSTFSRQYIPWDRDARPRVVVTFRGDDDRIWRVDKTFGRGRAGASRLEVSTDGNTFSVEAKGRQVDGELRTRLGWGIAGPGGKSAPRGLPDSFLATALLGDQEAALRILQRSFETDSDTGGRERLTSALQAFAQDPAFKAILEAATDRMQEAFSPTGKPRKARGAPFVIARDRVVEARRLRDNAEDELGTARRVQDEGHDLLRALNDASEGLAEWTERVGVLRVQAAEAEKVAQIRARHARAKTALDAIDAEIAELANADSTLKVLTGEMTEADDALKKAQSAHADARTAEKAAEAALRETRASDREQQRALHKAELERARDTAKAALESAESDAAARERHAAATKKHAETQSALSKTQDEERAAETTLTRAKADVEQLERARDTLDARRLRTQIADKEKSLADAESLRARITQTRRDATLREKEVADAPSLELVADLRKLQRDLELAEARCAVGVSLAIHRTGWVKLRAHVDGKPAETQGEHVELDAESRIALEVEGDEGKLVELVASAGASDARAAADALRDRWDNDAVPRLEGGTLDALDKRAQDAEDVRRSVAERRAEADRLEAQVAVLRDGASDIEVLRSRLVALEARLGDNRDDPEFRDEEAIADAREAANKALDGATSALDVARKARADQESEVAAAQRELDLAALPEGAPIDVAAARTTLEQAQAALQTLVESGAVEVQAAEKELTAAQAASKSATELLGSAQTAREAVAQKKSVAEGRRAVLAERVAQLDRDAAHAELAAVEPELEGLPEVDLEEGALERAERSLKEAKDRHAAARSALAKHEGRLELVGGAVAQERFDATEEALTRARLREQEVETEYGAWRLLVETMREAENAEGKHLGEALAGPVSQRFTDLLEDVGGDAERYGTLAFGAMLGTEGLEADGSIQSVGDLSVGTREQIATLLRLTIAQQLHAPLVLDDHLTHTDPLRARWFRDTLRNAAQDTQMLVITCHPRAYLDPEELPHEVPFQDDEEGLLRAIDATLVIR